MDELFQKILNKNETQMSDLKSKQDSYKKDKENIAQAIQELESKIEAETQVKIEALKEAHQQSLDALAQSFSDKEAELVDLIKNQFEAEVISRKEAILSEITQDA